MSPELQPLGRLLIVLGAALIAVGVVLMSGTKLPWLGRLPGDIFIQPPGLSFYFPITTSILLSLLLSLVIALFRKWH